MNQILHALSLLTPYEIDVPKIRMGPNTDGGYVFADRISSDQAIVSYGISYEYRFDAEMAERGHKVFMFDHTIDGIQASHPNMMWFREGVTGISNAAESLYSIEDHLQRHNIEGDRLILKMDVEGAEFESFLAIPDAVLSRFEQIVMEIHDLNNLANDDYRARFVGMLSKLNRQFTLFHVHANNYDGPDAINIVSGLPVSNLMELSYVRSSVVQRSPNRTLYPTAFDFPNVGHKDKLLWFYPYMPTTASFDEIVGCEERIEFVNMLQRQGVEL